MKKITKYLTEIRKNAIIYDLKLNGWKIYTIFLNLQGGVTMVHVKQLKN